jgi:hypothetical protein
MSEIILQGKSVGEALKQIWADIASYVIKKISEMLINYLLFQDAIKGYQGFQSGKGLLGWIASIFGYSEGGIIPGFKPIPSFAGGSLVYRPTLGIIGDSPEGPEAVIPLKGGKVPVEMMGQTSDQPNVVNYYVTNNYIDAVDLESFEKKYVPTVVGSLGKIKYRGTMKSLMRKNR